MKKIPKIEYLKTDFLRIYANIPLKLRADVICINNRKNWTWDDIYFAIKKDIDFWRRILWELRKLKII